MAIGSGHRTRLLAPLLVVLFPHVVGAVADEGREFLEHDFEVTTYRGRPVWGRDRLAAHPGRERAMREDMGCCQREVKRAGRLTRQAAARSPSQPVAGVAQHFQVRLVVQAADAPVAAAEGLDVVDAGGRPRKGKAEEG